MVTPRIPLVGTAVNKKRPVPVAAGRGRPHSELPTEEPLEYRLLRTVADGLDDIDVSESMQDYFDDAYGFTQYAYLWPETGTGHSGPTEYQQDILGYFPTEHRVAVRGPHGLGKTSLLSWIILWFACTREARGIDWKIATTAGAWHQLTHYLWPEIHKWANLLRPEICNSLGITPGKTLLQLNLRLRHGEGFAVASNRAELIEGAHATQLMYVYDEAKSIDPATWDAAEGAFSGGGFDTRSEAFAVAASTPGQSSGRFYEICMKRPGYEDWVPRHVTLEEAVKAGQISTLWANQRKRQWGAHSPLYLNRVLGEFASSAADTVIPLSWIEAAQTRWQSWKAKGSALPDMDQVAVDVGRGGNKTVIAPRHDNIIPKLIRTNVADTMIVADTVKDILEQNPGAYAMIDVVGIGAGVFDRLRQLQKPCHAFNAGSKSPFTDVSGELTFVNRRAEAWWRMRELLDPNSPGDQIIIPEDKEGIIAGDLSEPKWHDPGGRILVEEKEEVARRLGRSTDDGDAIIMAFAPPVTAMKRPISTAVAGERSGSNYTPF